MRFIFTFGLVVLFLPRLSSQAPPQTYFSINGIINGIGSGTIYMSDNGKIIDSSRVQDGKFFMRGNCETPKKMVFQILPGIWSFQAFVENSNIEIKVDTSGAIYYGKMYEDGWALLKNVKQKGSNLAAIYDKYKRDISLEYHISAYESLAQKADQIKDSTELKFIQKEMDKIQGKYISLSKGWISDFITKNRSSIVGPYILNELFTQLPNDSIYANLNHFLSLIKLLEGSASKSDYYNQLYSKLLNLQSVSSKDFVYEFNLKTFDKSNLKLSTVNSKYILLDFWASWCLPCRKAIPQWKEVYSKFKDKGLEIIGISNDRNWGDWINALAAEKMPWLQVIDEFPSAHETAKTLSLFGVPSMPYYVLLNNEKKKIIGSFEKDEVIAEINKVLNEKIE